MLIFIEYVLNRYVICENLLEHESPIQEYLMGINLNIIQLREKEKNNLDVINVSYTA